jgi:NAD(P)-dependent dehydrogenase (short-subunit alcohol dehydrogenase family)
LTASIGASKGSEELNIYHASNPAIRSFIRTWTLDLKHRKIHVNAVSPGSIDTPFVYRTLSKQQSEQFLNNIVKFTPMAHQEVIKIVDDEIFYNF